MLNVWVQLHPRATPDHLGALATFIDIMDERSAKEQIEAAYPFGGWASNTIKGFKLDTKTGALSFPGDPDLVPLFGTVTRGGEVVTVYSHAIVSIVQPTTMEFEVARLD